MSTETAVVDNALSTKAKEARSILGKVQSADTEIHHLVNAIQVMAFNISYPIHFDKNFDWDDEEKVWEAARTCSEALAAIAQLARQAKDMHAVNVKSGEVQSFLFSLLSPEEQAEELGE